MNLIDQYYKDVLGIEEKYNPSVIEFHYKNDITIRREIITIDIEAETIDIFSCIPRGSYFQPRSITVEVVITKPIEDTYNIAKISFRGTVIKNPYFKSLEIESLELANERYKYTFISSE